MRTKQKLNALSLTGLRRTPELPADAIVFTTKAFASYPELFDALARGTVAGAVVTGAYCTRYAEEISAHGFIRHETSLGNVEYAIASAADEPAVAQLAELFIYDLQKSGELDALLKKYGL